MADKPQIPTLEDIAQTASYYGLVTNLAEQKDHATQVDGFMKYLSMRGGEDAVLNYQNRPYELSKSIAVSRETEQKGLVAQTEQALQEVLGKLTTTKQDPLIRLALKLGLGKDKNYVAYETAIQNQDTETIRNNYQELYGKDKDGKPTVFAKIAKIASGEQLLEFAQSQIRRTQEGFITKNLMTIRTEEKDGKPQQIAEYDPAKTQAYLTEALSKEKDKTEHYTQLGMLVAQQLAEERKAREEARKKP